MKILRIYEVCFILFSIWILIFKIFILKKLLILLYTSKSLLYFWNFGSLLGMILLFQLFSGLFLVFYYSNDSLLSFDSIQYIIYEVFGGWFLRILHFNGASLFFLFLYIHFFKGLFFFSYRLKKVWLVGILIFLLFMIVAFIGYVLVWAQIRFWASVVITSLLTVIPFWGFNLVFWIWGGFSVTSSTLKFFFVFHFLLPWLSWIFVLFHLFFLHSRGRTSNLYCFLDLDKVNFFPYFIIKDILNLLVFIFFIFFSLSYPFYLGDSEIFLESNILVSPIHIVPEWYFLFAYAILRCVPNKILGVFLLLMRILVFLIFLFIDFKLISFDLVNSILVFSFITCGIILRWLGQCLIEFPYIIVSVYASIFYFFLILILILNLYFSWFFFI